MSGQVFIFSAHENRRKHTALQDRRGLYGTGFEKTGFKYFGEKQQALPCGDCSHDRNR